MAWFEAQVGPASTGLRFLAIAASIAGANAAPATAGAWGVEPGGHETINTIAVTDASWGRGADFERYSERGMAPGVTLITKPRAEVRGYDASGELIDASEIEVGVRQSLQPPAWASALSVQGDVYYRRALSTPDPESIGAEVRGAVGWSGGSERRNWYVDLSVAARIDDRIRVEPRVEATYGVSFGSTERDARWGVRAQVFHDAPPFGSSATKAQITLLAPIGRGRHLLFGLRERVGGSSDAEHALVLGWTTRRH
jgi:hypothetical protein